MEGRQTQSRQQQAPRKTINAIRAFMLLVVFTLATIMVGDERLRGAHKITQGQQTASQKHMADHFKKPRVREKGKDHTKENKPLKGSHFEVTAKHKPLYATAAPVGATSLIKRGGESVTRAAVAQAALTRQQSGGGTSSWLTLHQARPPPPKGADGGGISSGTRFFDWMGASETVEDAKRAVDGALSAWGGDGRGDADAEEEVAGGQESSGGSSSIPDHLLPQSVIDAGALRDEGRKQATLEMLGRAAKLSQLAQPRQAEPQGAVVAGTERLGSTLGAGGALKAGGRRSRQRGSSAAAKAAAEAALATQNRTDKLMKPYRGPFVMTSGLKGWKAKDLIKVPKFLGEEGRLRRMRRGKVGAATQTLKWDHIGAMDPMLLASPVVPPFDAVRHSVSGTPAVEGDPGEQYGSCAVIGNGGGLLLHKFGAEIDAHDAVIRFNGGPVRGFEEHVGSKTTWRLCNSEPMLGGYHAGCSCCRTPSDYKNICYEYPSRHFGFMDGEDETALQHVTNKLGFDVLKAWLRNPPVQRPRRLFVIDPAFHYHAFNVFGHGAPSNGFYGALLASERCRRVTLFGFQKQWRGQKLPYHYYNEIEPNESQSSRDQLESDRFSEWMRGVNEYYAADEDWMEWAGRDGWHGPKFSYAEENLIGNAGNAF